MTHSLPTTSKTFKGTPPQNCAHTPEINALLCTETMLLTPNKESPELFLTSPTVALSPHHSHLLCPAQHPVSLTLICKMMSWVPGRNLFPEAEGTAPPPDSPDLRRSSSYNIQNLVHFSSKPISSNIPLLGNLIFPILIKKFHRKSWQTQFRIYTKQL